MLPLQRTLTITLDENVFEVASMSDATKRLVEYFDDWRLREQELTSDLLMVQGALRDLQQSLLAQVQAELAERAKLAEAAAAETVAEPETVVKSTRSRNRK